MLVVDTSDSMSEDDGSGKRIKIDGAREALIDFTRAIPTTTRVGLRTYPASGKVTDSTGCSVGDAVVPLGTGNLSTVDARIRQLSASGGTPTGPALQRAADDLRAAGESAATIVLVSDGESNCGPDPCEVAGRVAASGIDVTVNTVGFRISDTGKQQLQCIASKTDGLYADADDTAQLARELDALSRPLLDVHLDHPATAKAAVGTDEHGLVSLTATVTNVGSSEVTDAQLTFVFGGDVRPTVLSPRRRLGNLKAGETRETLWQFRPPLLESDQVLRFGVTGRGRNSAAVTAKGSITLSSGLSLADAGPILRNAKRVAVLGDSYSSGEGAGDFLPGTETLRNTCHRSRGAYALSLWNATPGYHADVFACSGAVSHDLENANANEGEVPQIVHLAQGTAYDAVLMTMGGNDIGFSDIAARCVVDIKGDCTRFFGGKVAEARGLEATLRQDYRTVEGSLNTKANIAERHGRVAPLIVLAYPSPFPLASRNACSRAYTPGEQRLFQQIVEGLSDAAAAAAAALHDEGLPVYFVPDTIDAFQPDHTYCSSEPYINTLQPLAVAEKKLSPVVDVVERTTPSLLVIKAIQDVTGLTEQQKVAATTAFMRQIHPNRVGYRAMTAELVRWSTTGPARRPVERTATFLPVTTNPGPDLILKLGPDSTSGGSIQPGGVLQVQGSGLPPGSMAALQVRSDPVTLDRQLVGEDGRVVLKGRVPRSLRVGRHSLVVQAESADGRVEFTVPLVVQRRTPRWLLPLGGLGLAASAAGLLVWRRSRPVTPTAAEPF